MTVEVVAVGPGRRSKSGARIPMDVKPGDSVFIGRWTGTEVEIDGETLLVIRESDILAVESDSE
jgi:chaperonin GroES